MGHSLGWDRNRPHSLPSYGLLSIGCPHLGCQRAAIHDVSCTLAALHARLARRRTGAARACIIASLYICVFFIFIFFIFVFYKNIFSILQFTVLYPYRPPGGAAGAAAPQEGGRDLFVNKKNLFARTPLAGACRHPAATPLGGRGPAARQGGGRLPPPL